MTSPNSKPKERRRIISVVIIVNGGGGRAAIRRFEAATDPSLTLEQVTNINNKIADLEKLANDYGCPEDPCPE